jgi:hypothetical protein
MAELVIKDETLVKQIRSMYHEQGTEADWSYGFVTVDFYDTWRWGNLYLLVIKDKFDGRLWGTLVEEQSGDNYHLSLDENDEIRFKPVELVSKPEYRFVKS